MIPGGRKASVKGRAPAEANAAVRRSAAAAAAPTLAVFPPFMPLLEPLAFRREPRKRRPGRPGDPPGGERPGARFIDRMKRIPPTLRRLPNAEGCE